MNILLLFVEPKKKNVLLVSTDGYSFLVSIYSQVDDAAIYDVEEEETFSLDDIRSASTQTDVQTGPLTSHQVFSSLGYFYDISLLLFRLVAVALKKNFFFDDRTQ